MLQVNIHEAKTHLSALLERTAKGESFIIAKAGKPIATVSPIIRPVKKKQRIGFLKGQFTIPEDFNQMGAEEIVDMIEGKCE